ncbi:hypothetical protein GCM10007103_26950 [Salinimicrobium marinum]|uniref:LVIVD repeat-containing protein n=2 Tax=Salinimicrobium marinum TaxID=680283 RepID=A0A918SJF2_9FLAO|nr:hypothetical protein GCM10007103_26950 [Salinimicrobium marinum]
MILFLLSCDKGDDTAETYQVAVPVTLSVADFRASVRLEEPKEIEQSGKIYVYEDFIFINDNMKGILVVDNSNYHPEKIKYINIPQNTDIAIKGNVLYANSGRDLVTFDISDIHDIEILERLENVFHDHLYPELPASAAYLDFKNYNYEKEVIVGYTLETREKTNEELGWINEDIAFNSAGDGTNSGTGGSMARFNIGGDFLYTVGKSDLQVFDISNLSNPQKLNSHYVGWQIETIFNKEGYLYLGSAAGMFIYSLEDPAAPAYMSEITHVLGCDPVVVANDIAYVTIRGGNLCGQNLNQLEVIDVSDKTNPQLLQVYEMDGPYGLGVRENKLFVCDGSSGLKIYDATNTPTLVLEDHFPDVNAYDVIPTENVLVLIGENILRQYSYKNNEINLISSYDLN